MINKHIRSILVLGCAGSIGKNLLDLLSKDYRNIMAIDKDNCEINSKDIQFINDDLSNGYPDKAISFINDNCKDGIALINCIGLISSKSFLKLDADLENHQKYYYDQIESLKIDFETNFLIPITLSTQFANLVVGKRGFGTSILFSSVASMGNPGQLGYSAMKAALETAGSVLSKEYGQLDISFNAIAPGFIESTSMRKQMTDKSIDAVIRKTSQRRLGRSSDLYEALKMLINCNYINGQTIRVDGGLIL